MYISVSEVHKKTGAELVSTGIVGRNLRTKKGTVPKLRPTIPFDTSSAPVIL